MLRHYLYMEVLQQGEKPALTPQFLHLVAVCPSRFCFIYLFVTKDQPTNQQTITRVYRNVTLPAMFILHNMLYILHNKINRPPCLHLSHSSPQLFVGTNIINNMVKFLIGSYIHMCIMYHMNSYWVKNGLFLLFYFILRTNKPSKTHKT